MSTVILPVGKPDGAFFGAGAADGDKPEYCAVQVADDVEELTFDEWVVWLAAHDLPERQRKHEFTRYVLRDYVRTATDSPVSNPVPHIENLLRRGLLVEADLLESDQESFLRRYRLIPTGFGMGNQIDDTEMTWVGQLGQRLVALAHRTYQVYAYSYRVGSIWDACVEFAGDHSPEEGITPEDFSDGIADALPHVVCAIPLAFLEPVS